MLSIIFKSLMFGLIEAMIIVQLNLLIKAGQNAAGVICFSFFLHTVFLIFFSIWLDKNSLLE